MLDVKMEGHQKAPAWFWVSLALLLVGTIIAYILLHDDRRDQINIEKGTATYFQTKMASVSELSTDNRNI